MARTGKHTFDDSLGAFLKEGENEADFIPSASQLANLAAQSRFAQQTPEAAVAAAIKLWDEAVGLVRGRIRVERALQWSAKHPTPMPPEFPAGLHDFYKLIVRGRSEPDNQPRFKRFLRNRITERWAKDGRSLTEDGILDVLEWELTRYKTNGFADEYAWVSIAGEYERWWAEECKANRVRAGRMRAAKAAAAKREKNEFAKPLATVKRLEKENVKAVPARKPHKKS